MSGKRRNPGLAGTAGITGADLDALDQRRVTLQDLADKLGVSKQAVGKRIKAMRSTSTAATSTASAGSTVPAGVILIDAHQAAVSTNLAILHRAAGILEGPDALGPSAVKALAGAIARARAELALLGVLAPDDAEVPTELKVRVLTDAEHAEIKRRVELPDDHDD